MNGQKFSAVPANTTTGGLLACSAFHVACTQAPTGSHETFNCAPQQPETRWAALLVQISESL